MLSVRERTQRLESPQPRTLGTWVDGRAEARTASTGRRRAATGRADLRPACTKPSRTRTSPANSPRAPRERGLQQIAAHRAEDGAKDLPKGLAFALDAILDFAADNRASVAHCDAAPIIQFTCPWIAECLGGATPAAIARRCLRRANRPRHVRRRTDALVAASYNHPAGCPSAALGDLTNDSGMTRNGPTIGPSQ